MMRFLAKRLAWSLFVVFAVVSLVFLLVYAWGDPAKATLGANAREEQLDDFRHRYGLDEPLPVQYASYLGVGRCVRRNSPAFADRGRCGLLQGDFGESYSHNEPVSDVIAHRLPRTLLLGGLAILFELILGLGIGIAAALYRQRWVDSALMSVAFVGLSLPTFVTGPIFLSYVAFRLGWFPVGGYGFDPWSHLYHAVLPAFALAIVGAATYARLMRSEMLETLNEDYVRTAAAKGLSRPRVVLAHAARNALLPIVTVLGLSLPLIVSGAIVTEHIFAWPGMGALAVESIHKLDAPTIIGVVVVTSLAVQAGNLLADLAVAALDPRVRLHGAS